MSIFKFKSKTFLLLLLFCSWSLLSLAQGKPINGNVADANGEPVIGATILLKGTSTGTITDLDGNFSIYASPQDVVVVSYVGYNQQEVAVGDRSFLQITLQEDTENLEEVVVIGYGSVKKSNLTTSVSKIDSEALSERPLTTLSEAFSGQLAGVSTQIASGVPGEDLQITIRGNSSLNSASTPLYVIDGVISESMNDVNPIDVASIQILKDAAATSIYGARGSNGVVLIETKSAQSGKPTVNFEGYYGLQQADRLPEVMSPTEWFAYNIYVINAIYLNKGGNNSMEIANKNRPTGDQIPSAWLLNPDSDTPDWRLNPNISQTNWIDEILRVAPIQSYQISASGKSDIGSIYFSGGYFNQEGIVKNTGYDRINFRVNGTLNIGKNLRIGASYAPSKSKQRRGEAEGKDKVILTALQYPPLMSINSGTRELGYDPLYPNNVNPYERLMQVTDNMNITRSNASVWLEWDIIKGLTFKSIYNNNTRTSIYEYFIPGNVVAPNAAGGAVSSGNSYSDTYNNWGIQNILSFDRTFREKHTLSAMLGQSADVVDTYRATVEATGFPLENVYTLNVATTPLTASTERTVAKTASFFGRVSYDYADKYLVTASLRRDGSSRFGSGNRWGWFPSFSAGWKISEESFLKENPYISLLKLRGSWGLAGNDQIGLYDYLSTFDIITGVYGNEVQSGMIPGNFANPDLKWESTRSIDVGLDLSLFKNRIQVNFDYYVNTTRDLLYNLQLPATTGFETMRTNLATIENSGWEIDFTSTNINRSNFKWTSSLNLSHNNNKILDLGGTDNLITTAWNSYFITKVGGPISQFYVFRTNGLLTEDDFGVGPDGRYDASQPLVPIMDGQLPGNYKFVDQNGDGTIDDNDRVAYGDNVPDLTYGFTNRFSYKGIELSIFLQGQFGGDVFYLASRNIGFGKRQNNCLDNWLHSYKATYKGGDPIPHELGVDMSWDGKTPMSWGLGKNGVDENTVTDQRIYDATFLKIKNITLSYSFPTKLLEKVRMRQARIYATIENLHTFTEYIGNPEVNSYNANNPILKGVDYSTYPLTKKYTVGLSLTF